jgi:hypothetical protein
MNEYMFIVLFFDLVTVLCAHDATNQIVTFRSTKTWKCCPFGKQFVHKKCRNVSDVEDKHFIENVNIPFPINISVKNYCDNSSKIRYVLNENEDTFSVSWNNMLYYNNRFLDDFCVDYNFDRKGLRVLVCEFLEIGTDYGSIINSYGNYDLTNSAFKLNIYLHFHGANQI